MKSLEEVYNSLKKYDRNNCLTLNAKKDTIELKLDDEHKVTVYDTASCKEAYFSVEIGGRAYSHYHLDYDETYRELLNYIEKKLPLPTASELKKDNRKKMLDIFICFFVPFLSLFIIAPILDSTDMNNGLEGLLFLSPFFLVWIIYFIISKIRKSKMNK